MALLALWKRSPCWNAPPLGRGGSPLVTAEQLKSVGMGSDVLRLLWERDLARPTHFHSMVATTLTVDRRLCLLADVRLPWFISPSGKRLVEAALNTVGGLLGSTNVLRPCWDRRERELRYAGLLVKRLSRSAPHQELILETFEELGWPERIDDPLPGQAGCVAALRMHDAINRLNRHLERPLLQFGGDGTGCGVCWRPRGRTRDGSLENRASAPIDTGSAPSERIQ